MKDFLKFTFAAFFGVILSGIFAVVMLIVMTITMGIIDSLSSGIKDDSILRIHLSGEIIERSPAENPFDAFFGNNLTHVQGLDELKTAIAEAATNKHVRGIYLDGGLLGADFAILEELRAALAEFKKSRKFIVAHADHYTQGAYYVASVADEVMLNPSGNIDWHGIASQPIFYTGLLEKIGVKMQVFKVGKFKSAVEPYILTEMSEANRTQVSAFVNDIWQGVVKAVGASRRLSADSLNAYANRYVALSVGQEFQRLKLVDRLAYADQVRDRLRQRIGGKKLNLVTPPTLTEAAEGSSASDKVAVYYASGAIVDVAGTGRLMGMDEEIVGSRVVEDLDALANDKQVKAVVLRINSGGGSAYASEQMWRAIQLLKKKKPVVVSMSGMAASGGYYMACGANTIFADPTTLTGSIGIFARIPDASQLLTEKLGLSFDVVKTNTSSDFGAMGRPFSAAEGAALQAHVDQGYRLFLTRVAEGRTAAGKKMNLADVDSIGQGRVWTGQQALKIGLVDRLGGLDAAIAHAAQLAKVKDYATTSYPAAKTWLEDLQDSGRKDDYLERKLRTALGVYYEPLTFLHHMDQNDRMQARIFFLPNLR